MEGGKNNFFYKTASFSGFLKFGVMKDSQGFWMKALDEKYINSFSRIASFKWQETLLLKCSSKSTDLIIFGILFH